MISRHPKSNISVSCTQVLVFCHSAFLWRVTGIETNGTKTLSSGPTVLSVLSHTPPPDCPNHVSLTRNSVKTYQTHFWLSLCATVGVCLPYRTKVCKLSAALNLQLCYISYTCRSERNDTAPGYVCLGQAPLQDSWNSLNNTSRTCSTFHLVHTQLLIQLLNTSSPVSLRMPKKVSYFQN